MKLYIKAFSSYRSDTEDIDIKKELKQTYKKDTRRKDAFIHLAMFGAQRLQDKITINSNDELYMTSGVGNAEVLQRVDEYVHRQGQCIKPFDFINMLGNTTSYYVADSLNLTGKNIFQISDNFTFINSLISIYASISSSKKNAILGSIDLINEPQEIIKRVLGIDKDTNIISSVNYQYLTLDSHNSLAKIEFDTKIYTLNEINDYLSNIDTKIYTSNRCLHVEGVKDTAFFETLASWVINNAILKSEDITYIDCIEDRYKIVTLKIAV